MRLICAVLLLLLVLMTSAQCQTTAKYLLDEGYALCVQGKYDEAIKAYDEAIRLDPQLAMAWDNKGCALFFLAENESQAEKMLADPDLNRSPYLNTKYVMIDQPMDMGEFHVMASQRGIPVSKYMDEIYQKQGDLLVPLLIWRESYFKSMTVRMFFFDGTEVAGRPEAGVAYRDMVLENGVTIPVLTEAPMMTKNHTKLEAFINERRSRGDMAEIVASSPENVAFPLDALQHYRLVHESKTPVTSNNQRFVKIFEHVPGAVIKGNAPAGTKVTAAVPIITNQNRTFVYQQSNISDGNGQFTLVLPYSTEGPIASSTNFDTRPLGPYQVSVGDKTYEVRVPEEYVLSRSIITI